MRPFSRPEMESDKGTYFDAGKSEPGLELLTPQLLSVVVTTVAILPCLILCATVPWARVML